jgi:thiamine biosynthesis lipoprotein
VGVSRAPRSEIALSRLRWQLEKPLRTTLRISSALLLGVAFYQSTFAGARENLVRYEASHEAMGTVFTIAAYGRDQIYLSEVVNQAFEKIDQLDEQMSNYKPESELSVINREAARQAVIVEPRLFKLIQVALGYSQETGGAFDPTVGPLMEHWGFFRGHGRLPSTAEITQVLKRVGYRRISLDPPDRSIRFDESGIELDLGAIAKGYTVDRVVDILRSDGITAALVSSGTSSIYALGSPPGERGWKVTVRDPYDARKPGDVFHLQNWSLSISGNYEKFFSIGGKTYCHIMNPRTGWPVENMLSTTVLAETTTESDVLSTSFFVLGPDGSRKLLADHPNLMVVFYQPSGRPPQYRRKVLRSHSFSLPGGSIAEMKSRGDQAALPTDRYPQQTQSAVPVIAPPNSMPQF